MSVEPGPGALPLGHLHRYVRDRLGFFAASATGSAPVVRCRLVGDGYLLREPEDIRHVLVRNQTGYVKSRRLTGPRARYPKPHSLLTSAGLEHRRRRRVMQQLFRRPLVDRLASRARANAAELADSWADGDEVDVAGSMTELAQRNVFETLLGSSSERRLRGLAGASRARQRAIERLFLSLSPLPEYHPTRANRDSLLATRRFDALITEEIAARRSEAELGDDLLSMLIGARFDDGSAMTDGEIRDEARTLALTGYDSVSAALAWTHLLLARHPDVDAGVAREASSGMQQAGYIASVVKESLRLFPPTWMFVRIALHDDTLPSGAVIPARAKVYLCSYVVHRDNRFWPAPDRFDPGRFGDGSDGDRPRYSYFPFGGGSHVCIGEALAIAQVTAVLAEISRRRRLRAPTASVTPDAGLTLRPAHGLTMRVEHRA